MAERIEFRRATHVAALWANSNYDSQKEGQEPPRTELSQAIEKAYDDMMATLYGVPTSEEMRKKFKETLKKDPFFSGMKLPKSDDDKSVVEKMMELPEYDVDQF